MHGALVDARARVGVWLDGLEAIARRGPALKLKPAAVAKFRLALGQLEAELVRLEREGPADYDFTGPLERWAKTKIGNALPWPALALVAYLIWSTARGK
jgi:hypothetical protein